MALSIDDLGLIQEELIDVCINSYDIGLQLKVPVGKLNSIKVEYSKPSDQLREMLMTWLKTDTLHEWQTIADALKSRTVGESKLASDIEAKYCHGSLGQASGQEMPRNTQIEALQQQVLELQQFLESKTQPQQIAERLERKLREQHCAIEAGQSLQQELNQQLQLIKLTVPQPQEIDQIRQKLQEQQHTIDAGQRQQCELKEQLQSIKRLFGQPQPNPPQKETTFCKLIWRNGAKAPQTMRRGSVATDGTMLYCNGDGSTSVHQYHSDTQQWSTLPDLPHILSTLVMADRKLTSVGGYLRGKAIDSLLSLTLGIRGRMWSQHFPPMTTKRYWTAAIYHSRSLIIAGGLGSDGHERLATVEVLNMDTWIWFIASSLPHPFYLATASICGERLYLLGGEDQTGYLTRSVLTCSITELLHSRQTLRQSAVWQRIADAPYKGSSCATLCGQLVVMGGSDESNKDTTAIFMYKESTNSWLAMEAMKIPRYRALVAGFDDNTIMAVGGYHGELNTVEIAKVLTVFTM